MIFSVSLNAFFSNHFSLLMQLFFSLLCLFWLAVESFFSNSVLSYIFRFRTFAHSVFFYLMRRLSYIVLPHTVGIFCCVLRLLKFYPGYVFPASFWKRYVNCLELNSSFLLFLCEIIKIYKVSTVAHKCHGKTKMPRQNQNVTVKPKSHGKTKKPRQKKKAKAKMKKQRQNKTATAK